MANDTIARPIASPAISVNNLIGGNFGTGILFEKYKVLAKIFSVFLLFVPSSHFSNNGDIPVFVKFKYPGKKCSQNYL